MSIRRSPLGTSPIVPTSSTSRNSQEFDLTILAELNKIKDVKEQFPAANLLNALLRFFHINVNTGRRDIHTSAQVALRSNKLYETIIALMQKLDQSSFQELENNWHLFENYTTAIPILERVLLEIVDKTNQDLPHSPPNTSTQEAVQHIAIWLADRKALKRALEDLKAKPLLELSPESAKAIAAEYVTHRRKDDESTIKVLLEFIGKDQLTDKDIYQDLRAGQKYLTDVKTLIKQIIHILQQKPLSEEASGVVVRAIMTVYIPFAVLSSPKTDDRWKTYLKSAKIWEALTALLTKVKEYLEKPVADLDSEFAAMEALLLKVTDSTIETAKEMQELIKLAAYIHRPYSGRTVALVKAYYHVDQFSRRNKALVGQRHGLKQAMQVAAEYLTKVGASPYDLSTFSLESKDYKGHKEEHQKQFDSTRIQYTNFGISPDWDKWQTAAYAIAVDVDEKNVRDALGKLFGK